MASWLWLLVLWCPAVLHAQDVKAKPDSASRIEVDLRSGWSDTELSDEDTQSAMVDRSGPFPCFRVVQAQNGTRHFWRSGWFGQPVDMVHGYPILVLSYRATGYDTRSKHYALTLNDGLGPRQRQQLWAVMCKQIISDGQVHELRVDLRTVKKDRPAGPLLQMTLAVGCDPSGRAEFELRGIAFERDPAEGEALPEESLGKDGALAVAVLDEHGRPVSGARVSVDHMIQSRDQAVFTDAQGQATLEPWRTSAGRYALTITHEGMTPVRATGLAPGDTAQVRLEKSCDVSGEVVDNQGKPLAGAVIQFLESDEDGVRGEMPPGQSQFWPVNVMSDAQGKWVQHGFAASRVGVDIAVWHPSCIRPYVILVDEKFVTAHALSDGPVRIVARQGWSITGKVVDHDGHPVANAVVLVGDRKYRSEQHPSGKTDEQGVYHVSHLTDADVLLVVTKAVHGAVQAMVHTPDADQEVTHDFQMSIPGVVRFLVLDGQGKPLSGVWVNAGKWGQYRGKLWSAKTNKKGQAVWKEAPAEPVNYSLYNKVNQDAGLISPGGEENVLTMNGPVTIAGSVTDADTGLPIPSFRMRYATPLPHEPPGQASAYRWQEHAVQYGKDGTYKLTITSAGNSRYVCIQALGYEPVISPAFPPDQPTQRFDVKLKPSSLFNGVVLAPDGKPAQGAIVFDVQLGGHARFRTDDVGVDEKGFEMTTEADGLFFLPVLVKRQELAVLVVTHASGYAELRGGQLDSIAKIALQPWATISGISKIGSKPDVVDQVHAYQIENPLVKEALPIDVEKDITWIGDARTDSHGRFEIKVPAGGYKIGRMVLVPSGWFVMTQPQYFNLKSGDHLEEIQFGGVGRPLVGQLAWQGQPKAWKTYDAYMTLVPDENAPITVTPLNDNSGTDLQDLADHYEFHHEGPLVTIGKDYTLRANDVKEGTYDLSIVFYEKNSFEGGPAVGVVEKRIVVPPIPGGQSDDPQELGTFTIQIPVPLPVE